MQDAFIFKQQRNEIIQAKYIIAYNFEDMMYVDGYNM